MILGRIFGKITTKGFQFLVEREARKFEFVQVLHKVYDYVLCQIIEIERTDKDIAKCTIIGYKDDKGRIKPIMIPFEQNSEVLRAEDEFVKSILALEESEKGALIGRIEGKDIDIRLDLKKLLTKHVAILAKSGAGKSYCVGVLIEEILEKRVPILVIDPHGEYSSLTQPNLEEKEAIEKFQLFPKGLRNIYEYGDTKINSNLRPLKLNDNLTAAEIVHLIPGKLSNTQLGLIYSSLKHLDKINFTNVLLQMEKEENSSKWAIINNLEYLNSLELFSPYYVPFNEMIQPGRCSIVNMKGIPPDVQEIIVYKLMKDLFEERKQEKIPPFFTVLEEAHNYCPERSFGETRCSKIIRTVASEGRKFGLGLCIVSQRPARVDKSVLSQCTTQFILKVTNPNDLKAISASVEGITAESEDEIKNLPVGNALITGVVDMPLFVSIRPRMTKHGGHAADVLEQAQEEDFFEKVEDFQNQELLPLIMPKLTPNDIKLMSDNEVAIETVLVPAYLLSCVEKDKEFNLLVEAVEGKIVVDVDNFRTKALPELARLTPNEIRVLHTAFLLKHFSEEDVIKKGMPLDVRRELFSLQKNGFIEKKEGRYELSDGYVFSQLSKNACHSKIQYLSISYSRKVVQEKDIDTIRQKLSSFASIRDQRECFIVKYDVVPI